jgi:low affinity Fe/Cu permease
MITFVLNPLLLLLLLLLQTYQGALDMLENMYAKTGGSSTTYSLWCNTKVAVLLLLLLLLLQTNQGALDMLQNVLLLLKLAAAAAAADLPRCPGHA